MLDPYHRWLAIPPGHRPPTYYQLLGIATDETDREVIEEATLRQTSHVRTYQTGPHSEQCTALLNEIARARTVLLNPDKRRDYDARLRSAGALVVPAPPLDPVPSAAPLEFPIHTDRPEPRVAALPRLPFRKPAVYTSSSRLRSFFGLLVGLAYFALLLLAGGLGYRLATSGGEFVVTPRAPKTSPASRRSRVDSPYEPLHTSSPRVSGT